MNSSSTLPQRPRSRASASGGSPVAKRQRSGALRVLAIRTESFDGLAEDSLSMAAELVPPPIFTSASLSDMDSHSPFLARPPSGGGRSGGGLQRQSSSLRNTRSITREISEILPRLYVGSAVAAQSSAMLLAHSITHVLNCCTLPNTFEDVAGGPTYMRLGLMDSVADLPRMTQAIEDGVQFIHAALQTGGAVLVHCHRGISRSCTIAMAYIMWSQHKTAEDAFSLVRSKRRICDPNLGYLVTLKDYEAKVGSETLLTGEGGEEQALPYAAVPRVNRTRSSFDVSGMVGPSKLKVGPSKLIKGPTSSSPLKPSMLRQRSRSRSPAPPVVIKRAASI